MAGTTPKARALGAELRRAREEAGLGLRQLAAQLGTSHATVSRWENGARSPKPEDVAAYLAKVDASAELRAELVELARDPDGSHWLSVGMPDQHRQLAALLEIEREATHITTVSPLLVPGLLQTADYARTIMIAAEVPNDEVDMRVAVRLGRREAIIRKDAAELRAFIGESVLHQLIGGAAVMAEQLRALLKYSDMENVDLRVIPMSSGWHPGLEGPFSLDRFEDRTPVVQLENRISALFLHEPGEVAAYEHAVDKVAEEAMSSTESSELITEALTRMEMTK
ncbi:helix-turn-helix domain-containing protein [Saccharopolyspora shandongensis]|uniref:helix-turn-helix domain-containing protein n=1 Tax=Saccharopolyspora shandongensis TaxID=418495 RepID=UPI000A7F9390|nr:helix-turn-helix transcriptional regulator [Saccharopolyspora shandongensis]